MRSAGKRSERQKQRRKQLSDVGIRLKVDEPNLLENYSKHMRTKRQKKKKKTKKDRKKKGKMSEKASKTVVVESGRDPLLNILNETDKKKKDKVEIIIEEIPEDVPVPDGPFLDEEEEDPFIQEIKKVKVQRKPLDLSERDPENVKTMTITAAVELDDKKAGVNVRLE